MSQLLEVEGPDLENLTVPISTCLGHVSLVTTLRDPVRLLRRLEAGEGAEPLCSPITLVSCDRWLAAAEFSIFSFFFKKIRFY